MVHLKRGNNKGDEQWANTVRMSQLEGLFRGVSAHESINWGQAEATRQADASIVVLGVDAMWYGSPALES